MFESRGRAGAALAVAAALALAAGEAPAEVRAVVVPPAPGTALHVGTLGDTLEIVVSARDPSGAPVPGTPVRLAAPGDLASAGARPLSVERAADADGQARFRVELAGPPGDHLLLVSVPEAPPIELRVRVLEAGWGLGLFMGVGGGLAIFLYGMRLVGRGLEKAAGRRIRESLASLTASPGRSLVFGMLSTMAVQSSSASTVLLVSFAGAGLVTVAQCLGATLGAAVGSSFTVQLIAFRLSDWALLLVAIGFALGVARGRRRRLGGILFGVGLLFFGLQVMSDAMAPLKALPPVVRFFAGAADDPVPALLVAMVSTGVIQASTATIGIVLGLAYQGILTLDSALPFVFGANVGTATTALLASVSSNADGRRVAWAHAAFRGIGVLVFLPLIGPFAALVESLPGDLPRKIAHAHTLLNVGTAVLLLPFLPLADRALRALVRDDRDPEDAGAARALDPRFHEQPTLALAGALQEVLRMGQLVKEMLADLKEALRKDDEELARSIRERDDRVDRLDEEITRYLTDLSTEYLSEKQSARVLDLLFVTKDLELIADIVSKNLVRGLLRKKREMGLRFSDEGFGQLLDFHDRVRECVELAVASVATWDRDLARQVLERKRAVSVLERRLHLDHMARLQAGNEASRATTTVHVDAVAELKRIVTHSARVAYAVLGKVHELPGDMEAVVGEGDDPDSIDD